MRPLGASFSDGRCTHKPARFPIIVYGGIDEFPRSSIIEGIPEFNRWRLCLGDTCPTDILIGFLVIASPCLSSRWCGDDDVGYRNRYDLVREVIAVVGFNGFLISIVGIGTGSRPVGSR